MLERKRPIVTKELPMEWSVMEVAYSMEAMRPSDAAKALLAIRPSDIDPYRDAFLAYTTISMAKSILDRPLSRKELLVALNTNPSTLTRQLNSPILTTLTASNLPPSKSSTTDGRIHLWGPVKPSENPRLSALDKEKIQKIEHGIIQVLESPESRQEFLSTIGEQLQDMDILSGVLDSLCWITSVMKDAYNGLLRVPVIRNLPKEQIQPLMTIVATMQLFFSNRQNSLLGALLLLMYADYWRYQCILDVPLEQIHSLERAYNCLTAPLNSDDM